ncbi:MAG TPA: hypothetical protein VN088_14505 [Nocardioides sp.]|nr:hypothetical protein [Nocardioides sp.]
MTTAGAVVFAGAVILAVFALLALAEWLVAPRTCGLCEGTGVDPLGGNCRCAAGESGRGR